MDLETEVQRANGAHLNYLTFYQFHPGPSVDEALLRQPPVLLPRPLMRAVCRRHRDGHDSLRRPANRVVLGELLSDVHVGEGRGAVYSFGESRTRPARTFA